MSSDFIFETWQKIVVHTWQKVQFLHLISMLISIKNYVAWQTIIYLYSVSLKAMTCRIADSNSDDSRT